jgi:hypothetical protein
MRKVWTFLSNRDLSSQETEQLQTAGRLFVNNWTAHDNPLKADFEIHRQRILIFSVDEQLHNASGCSIDKLLRFIKETEQKLQVELLNRLLVAFENKGELSVVASTEVSALLKNGSINAESLVYNTAISNETELATWLQPLRETWLKKYLVTL